MQIGINMNEFIEKLNQRASDKLPENKAFFKKLKKNKPKNLDKTVATLHEKYASEIDCLQCANCCKTLGPRITDNDIQRIAKIQRLKPSDFVRKYLCIDDDKDYVFKSMPCPFLDFENYCLIYPTRPKACKEFPHTDRKRFHQVFSLTIKNTFVCPIVYLIVEDLKTRY